jgi:osmotically inducible lipoprotein OsmB
MPADKWPVRHIVRSAFVAVIVLSASACTQGDRNAALQGSAVGAAVGGVSAVVRGGSIATGALVGAAAGAVVTLVTRPLRRVLP